MALNDGATRKTLPSVASRQQKRIRRCSFDCSSGFSTSREPALAVFPPVGPYCTLSNHIRSRTSSSRFFIRHISLFRGFRQRGFSAATESHGDSPPIIQTSRIRKSRPRNRPSPPFTNRNRAPFKGHPVFIAFLSSTRPIPPN